jgi:hypothetical protein
MDTQFCFMNSGTCGISAEIVEAPLGDSIKVAATGRKPAAVTPAFSDNLPVAPDVTRKNKVEMAAQLPIIAVVFTVGGPLVYQRSSDQFG